MKEMTESEMENLDLEGLEEVHFTFDKNAFKSQKEIHCDSCNKIIKKTITEIEIPNSTVYVRLGVFRCEKCNKEYLDFEEAKKLEKALQISKLMGDSSYKITRALSFDGDNYIFRIPVEIARNLGKKPHVDMIPLSSQDFIIHLEKDN